MVVVVDQPRDRDNGKKVPDQMIGLQDHQPHPGRRESDLGPPSSVVHFTRNAQRPFVFQAKPLHTAVASEMFSIARHVALSSLPLRTAARRPTALNMRLARMGPNRFALRTLISKCRFLGGSRNTRRDSLMKAFMVHRSLYLVQPQPRNTLKITKPSCSTTLLVSVSYQSRTTLRVVSEMSSLLSCRLWRLRSRKEVRRFPELFARSWRLIFVILPSGLLFAALPR